VLLVGWPIARLITTAPSPRGVAPPPRQAVYRVLVVAQIAVTVALAAAAGLLAQSLASVRRQHPGFSVDRFVAVSGAIASQDLRSGDRRTERSRDREAAQRAPLPLRRSSARIKLSEALSLEKRNRRSAVASGAESAPILRSARRRRARGRTLSDRDVGRPEWLS
jgi:hypothetical protein